MDVISRKITNSIDINEIVVKRTKNYLYYKKHLEGIPNIIIPDSFKIKNMQTTPWVFFFYYKRAEELINYLIKKGIQASDFPTLHPSILGNPDFDFENNLYNDSVTLPVHQDLNKSDLEYIIKNIKEFEILCVKKVHN